MNNVELSLQRQVGNLICFRMQYCTFKWGRNFDKLIFCPKKVPVYVECNDRDDYDFDICGIFDQVWNSKQETFTQGGHSLHLLVSVFLYYQISLIKLFVVDPALDLFVQGSPSLFNTQKGCISELKAK